MVATGDIEEPARSSNARTSSSSGSKRKGFSQAKKRMEAMSTQVDHKLAGAFSIILGLYALITLGTWMKLEDQQFGNLVTTALSTTHTVATTRHPPAHVTSNSTVAEMIHIPESVKLSDIHDIDTLQHTFPVHVGDDMEEIDHPGIFLADSVKMKTILSESPFLPKDGKMRVPKFWQPQVYGKDVRDFLGEHGKRLITPEEASQVGSFYGGQETIYISIASYRDPECQPTVSDIFERAQHPERLRVAVIDQRAENDPVPPCGDPPVPCSQDPTQAICIYHHLIDVYEVPAPLSIGPVFARHLANRMYRGEYFAMQVDSHVRFIEHWDTNIIEQWRTAENEMAVLSVYLSDINGSIDPVTHANKHKSRPIMCKTDYESQGKLRHLRHGQQPEGIPGIRGEPIIHPFWAAGFSFARGHFVVQVPYDQYQPMVFQGEEIYIGLRGFTFGYDYYTPELSVAFHMYAIKDNKEKRKAVKLFWENSNLYPGSNVEGMKRLNGIIGMGDPDDTYYHGQEEQYGLGNVRPKDKFFKLYGIHTDTKQVEDHLCRFVGKPMQNIFKPHLRANKMGIDVMAIDYEFEDPEKKQV